MQEYLPCSVLPRQLLLLLVFFIVLKQTWCGRSMIRSPNNLIFLKNWSAGATNYAGGAEQWDGF